MLWLISQVPLYLTGFYESRIRPESQKVTQKVAGKKYGASPFTKAAFTMFVVDFALQKSLYSKLTNACYLSRRKNHKLSPFPYLSPSKLALASLLFFMSASVKRAFALSPCRSGPQA